ncbi:hypothetical protein BJX63DRAFT_110434 [Aspergillus granulosus]|uniref:Uncharacterized protein n=1 Tax=Aspergillus granulosus TaxID=176169 RepID=A0ABR4HPM7_9EURO
MERNGTNGNGMVRISMELLRARRSGALPIILILTLICPFCLILSCPVLLTWHEHGLCIHEVRLLFVGSAVLARGFLVRDFIYYCYRERFLGPTCPRGYYYLTISFLFFHGLICLSFIILLFL